MKRIIAVTAVAVSVAAGSLACGTSRAHTSGVARGSAQAATVYACPMHPDYHSDHPGKCPICGMRLEPRHRGGNAAGTLPDGALQVSPERQQRWALAKLSRWSFSRLAQDIGLED
jgi:hypothetical protein